MEVKMRFEKSTAIWETSSDSVAVELRGNPAWVEALTTLIRDFMKKQEGLAEHY